MKRESVFTRMFQSLYGLAQPPAYTRSSRSKTGLTLRPKDVITPRTVRYVRP